MINARISRFISFLTKCTLATMYDYLDIVRLDNITRSEVEIARFFPSKDYVFCNCEIFDRLCAYVILSGQMSVTIHSGEKVTSKTDLCAGWIITVPACWTCTTQFVATQSSLVLRVFYRTSKTELLFNETRNFRLENRTRIDPLKKGSLIYCESKNLSDSLCDEMISQFESSSELHQEGVLGKGLDATRKKSTDLNIARYNRFFDLDISLRTLLLRNVQRYFSMHDAEAGYYKLLSECHVPVLQIQKYSKGDGFFSIHHDQSLVHDRILVFMWYLNDVCDGGETEMYMGCDDLYMTIKPEKGKLVMFPSTSTYPHKANVPLSSDKYICTGWVISDYPFKAEIEASNRRVQKREQSSR